MEVSKFRKAMRPKKYLTRDFVVYQDPKRLAARSEMQAGGVVEREGFAKGPPIKFSPDTVRETIENYNNQLVYKDRNIIAKELGFKNTDGLTTYLIKNKIPFPELKKDKAKKIAESILNNLDESADIYLGSPLKVIGEKFNLPGSYITTSLKTAKEPILKEFAPFINKLSNPAFVKKWKGTGLTLSDVIDMHLSKVNLPQASTPAQDIMRTAARHYASTGPEKSKIQFFDIETNKPLTLDQATNKKSLYTDVYFKIKGNNSKFGIGISDSKNYVNLDLEGSQRPEFKEMYNVYNQKQALMDKEVINPKTGKTDIFRNVAGDMYKDTFKTSYERFPYDLDHLDLEKNPFSNVRLLPRRINQAAGLMKQHKAPKEYFDKIGYNYVKDVDQLLEDEMKLANEVLGPKQRKLYKPYMIAKGVERADPQFSYTPGQIKGLEKGENVFLRKQKPKLKLESGFKNFVEQLDVDPETREILNRLNNKLSMNPFDAEGLFKSEIAKMKKIGTPAAKFIGGVLGGLIAEIGFEAAIAIPAYSRGVDFDEILGNTLFGLAGAGKTRQEKVVEESGFDPDVVKYADLVNRKKQFIADAGFVEYFGKPGGDKISYPLAVPGEKGPLEKRLIENAQIIDKELDQLKEGSPLEQKFKQAEEKLEKRYAEKVEGSTPRKFLKETGESVLDYFKDQDQQLNKRMEELERLGFKKGGFGKIGRRSFLKLAAGLAAIIGGVRGGVKQLKTPIAKKVLKDAPTGTPDWFAPLVEKIAKEGIDVPGVNVKTTTTRETVKKLEVPNPESDGALTDKYYLFENPDTGEIRIDIDSPGLGANDGEFSLYFRPDRIDGITDDGIPMRSDGEFFVTEDRAVGRMNGPDDFDIELEAIDTDLSGSASDYHKVEEFATGKTNKKAQAEQLKKKDYIENNPGDDIESRYGPFDDAPPDDDY
jgi:hypothetical protein